MNYYGIEIKKDYDSNLNDQAIALLRDYYMLSDETTPQMSYARAALAFSNGDLNQIGRAHV